MTEWPYAGELSLIPDPFDGGSVGVFFEGQFLHARVPAGTDTASLAEALASVAPPSSPEEDTVLGALFGRIATADKLPSLPSRVVTYEPTAWFLSSGEAFVEYFGDGRDFDLGEVPFGEAFAETVRFAIAAGPA